jgi:hypothetical protein
MLKDKKTFFERLAGTITVEDEDDETTEVEYDDGSTRKRLQKNLAHRQELYQLEPKDLVHHV